jgi:hypothetical protein
VLKFCDVAILGAVELKNRDNPKYMAAVDGYVDYAVRELEDYDKKFHE